MDGKVTLDKRGLPRLHFEWTDPSGKHRHIWLCNFRRYGWAWTDEEAGEHGYAYGITYANSELPIFHLATTPETVIRDSLIATWAQLLNVERLEFALHFNAHNVHELLAWLYEDAVRNQTAHATPCGKRRQYPNDEIEIHVIEEESA